MSRLRVAIGEQLVDCPRVISLGVRSQIGDYTEQGRELLRAADIIFYPTARFVDLFATLGKETFPSVNCYRLHGNRLKQTVLLRLLGAPHPRTRVYYGYEQKKEILKDFAFPFIAKKPFGSADGRHVFFINNGEKLAWYTKYCNPAYIQEYVAAEQELRVVILNYHKVFGYRRTAAGGGLRSRALQGGMNQMDEVPPGVVALARDIARDARLSDVAVDMIFDGSQFWVLELNFQHDEMGDLHPGHDRLKMVREMIERGEL